MIPAVDVEIWGNCKEVPSKDELRAKLKVFMNWVEKELGCRPIIYTDQIFFLRYFYGAPSQELFWILNPLFEPFVGKAKKVLWQHSVSPLNGIDGDVDKNVFLGSPAEFENIRYKPLS